MKTYQTAASAALATLAVCLTSVAFAQQSAPGAERPMHAQRMENFKAADSDKDGQISKAEADKSMPRLAAHFDKLDTNKDGKLSADELRAMRGHKEHRRHGGAGPFGMADANRDRVVSRDELVQHHDKMLQDFDAADANKDGKLDANELKTWHDKMRAQRPARGNPPAAK